MLFDLIFIGLGVIGFFLPVQDNGFILTTAAHLMLASIGLIGGCLFCRWIPRAKRNKERLRLEKLPHQTMVGRLFDVVPYNTGKRTLRYSIDGFSRRLGSLDVYEHYHYEPDFIYDGFVGTFYANDGTSYYIRTMPDSFWGNPDQLPSTSTTISVTYVVDADDTVYFISSSQN